MREGGVERGGEREWEREGEGVGEGESGRGRGGEMKKLRERNN